MAVACTLFSVLPFMTAQPEEWVLKICSSYERLTKLPSFLKSTAWKLLHMMYTRPFDKVFAGFVWSKYLGNSTVALPFSVRFPFCFKRLLMPSVFLNSNYLILQLLTQLNLLSRQCGLNCTNSWRRSFFIIRSFHGSCWKIIPKNVNFLGTEALSHKAWLNYTYHQKRENVGMSKRKKRRQKFENQQSAPNSGRIYVRKRLIF